MNAVNKYNREVSNRVWQLLDETFTEDNEGLIGLVVDETNQPLLFVATGLTHPIGRTVFRSRHGDDEDIFKCAWGKHIYWVPEDDGTDPDLIARGRREYLAQVGDQS